MTHDRQHKRARATIATGLLAAIALAVISDTPATSQQPADDLQKVAWSKDKTEHPTDLDLGKKGPSPGDRLVTRGLFFDKNGSRKIGSYVGEIVTFNPKTLLVGMTVTATFPDGQLTLVGSLPFRRVLSTAGATLAITGGTGSYTGAAGTATIHAHKVRRDDGFLFTFDIAQRR